MVTSWCRHVGVVGGLALVVLAGCGPAALEEENAGELEWGSNAEALWSTDGGYQAPRPPAPEFENIPWQTGLSVGRGVAFKDTGNPMGENVFVVYAGSNVALSYAQAWAKALYKSWGQLNGVRYVYAVQGPNNVRYSELEIGNNKVATSIVAKTSARTQFIAVVAHSAGSSVAQQMLNMLAQGWDPANVTAGKVVYFSLDGAMSGSSPTTALSAATVNRLRKAYFVEPYMSSTNTYGIDGASMRVLGNRFGGHFTVDANGSGCLTGASVCLHATLVITRPHNPTGAVPSQDYVDFVGRPVTTAYLTQKAVEAGLHP